MNAQSLQPRSVLNSSSDLKQVPIISSSFRHHWRKAWWLPFHGHWSLRACDRCEVGCGSAGVRVARLMTWQERLATLRDIGRWRHALLWGLTLLEAAQVAFVPNLPPV